MMADVTTSRMWQNFVTTKTSRLIDERHIWSYSTIHFALAGVCVTLDAFRRFVFQTCAAWVATHRGAAERAAGPSTLAARAACWCSRSSALA